MKKYHRQILALSVAAVAGCALLLPVFTRAEAAEPQPQRSVGAAIDDSVITARVKTMLLSDTDIKGFDFKVDTRKGVVQLSGFVDNQIQADRAITLAQRVEGVQSVSNKVQLKNGPTTLGTKVDDGIVTTKVKSALIADPDVKGLQIGVVTRKGVVQLSGFVDSRNQADRAITVARGIEGVQSVDNDIRIKN
jgi:hyperosmotically inducible protein